MITKTFKLTVATDTEEEMQKEEEHLSMTYGAEEVEEENIEAIEAMKAIERQYEDATALLEIALYDIERLLNTPLKKCKDLARFRNISFMGGTLELPNVWRYADEARELIDKGKVNKTYNSCQICGKQISPYKGGMAIVQGADLYNGALTGEASATVTAAVGGTNTSGPKVMAIATKQLSQNIADNTANPLCANDYKEPQVVFENHCQDSRYRALGDTCSTLATNLGTGGNNQPLVVKEPVCIGNGQADQTKESELVGALNCMHDQQAVMTFGLDRAAYNQGQNALFNFSIEEEKIGAQVAKGPGAVCAVDCRNGKESEINATLQADADHNTNSNNVCRIEASVRRLTPMEAERLQGFPDFWTDIGEWIDSKGKKHKPADAPRYKALGNSIALPFWFWLLRRISATYTRQATLGSLFSGIGGFDICWELCNGPGTSKWVSEIEPFCVALLKRRFGDDETGEKGDAWKYISP